MKDLVAKLFWPVTAPIRFIQEHFKATLLVVILAFVLFSGEGRELEGPNLYRVDLVGPILDAEETLAQLEGARDPEVKGVLFVVNSPGGLVAPSVEISMAVKELAVEKPVVAYATGTMASGAYYASIGATKILANPGSMVGSIGVIFEMFNLEGAMEKMGVEMNVVKSGDFKEVGAFYRQWSREETAALKTLSDDIYAMFVADVAAARHLDPADKADFADGRVFIASKAKEAGLIDGVSSISGAETALAELAHVTDPVWNEKSPMEEWMERLGESGVRLALETAFKATGFKAY